MPAITPQQALPGYDVLAGALVSPGGGQGVPGAHGVSSFTLTTADFNVPAAGETVEINVEDTSWIAIGEPLWVETAGGNVNEPMALIVQAKTPTTLTLLNPLPTDAGLISSDTDNLIIPGSDTLVDLPPSQIKPVIWEVRTRSYNMLGNSTFEVDQKNCGAAAAVGTGSGNGAIDRWFYSKNLSTCTMTTQQGNVAPLAVIPGTRFQITSKQFYVIINTPQATLAANDLLQFYCWVEGHRLRELINDVHSVTLLVKSSYAPVTLTWAVRNITAPLYTLTKLFTIPVANQWTLITLPDLPVWTPNAVWNILPGAQGAHFRIGLAAGANYTSPANDVWVPGDFICGPGSDNYAALPANTTFSICFAQHEPGPECTPLIDSEFHSNLQDCSRYYQRSYPYGVRNGTVNQTGVASYYQPAGMGQAVGSVIFPVRMAKGPANIWIYSPTSGAINAAKNWFVAGDVAVTGAGCAGETGFAWLNTNAVSGPTNMIAFHWVADSGW
jgi:hypothetical protein